MRRRQCSWKQVCWTVVLFGLILLGFILFSFRFLLGVTALAIIIFGFWLMRCG